MKTQYLQLALETLESHRAKLQLQIAEIQSELRGTRMQAVKSGTTQSERMKAYWTAKKAPKLGSAKALAAAKSVHRKRTTSEKKAHSEAMKRYWAAKRKMAMK
jgi:hypothetical protein